MQRTCIGCGAMYAPRSPSQQRCQSCAVEHNRAKNLEYQHAFRQRHKTDPKPRVPDTERGRFEMLHAEGMSANAIALELGRNRRTVAKHLARPDVQRRVALLRLDGPEPELPC